MFARGSNDAAFYGYSDVMSSFPVMEYIDISTATNTIYEYGVYLSQDADHGAALRGFYFARQFCINELGYVPAFKIRYYLITAATLPIFQILEKQMANVGPTLPPAPRISFLTDIQMAL